MYMSARAYFRQQKQDLREPTSRGGPYDTCPTAV